VGSRLALYITEKGALN